MSDNFILSSKHCEFLFDFEDTLNIFNLLRLFKEHDHDEVNLDITNLSQKRQHDILTKFPYFLELYRTIISDCAIMSLLTCSKVSSSTIEQIRKKFNVGVTLSNNTACFDIETCKDLMDEQDPHLVKNVRGASLLSLVQDLIEIGKIKKSFSLFDEKSPIYLHSASQLLYNKDNAQMVWDVLVEWDKSLGDVNRINEMIHSAGQATERINESIIHASRSSLDDGDFDYLYHQSILGKFGLASIYRNTDGINIWFVDDQHANGWSRLLGNVISASKFNLVCLGSIADVEAQISLAKNIDKDTEPDLSLVDLRLSTSDIGVARYNADDLSGFQVVEKLLKQWSGLPIMIASASNKIWNMEKAIQKGAVAYWRKSDEVLNESPQESIQTAFDIYLQLIEKLSTLLCKMKYRNIFRIVEQIRVEISNFSSSYSPLKLVIDNFFKDLDQKTSWMCWRKEDEEDVNDSLYLSVQSIYNELENFLWDKESRDLILVDNKKIKDRSKNSDSLIINDTLEKLDDKYNLTGRALEAYYESNKSVRNKLPTIHGSVAAEDVQHAKILNIESSLLIVLCILTEIKRTGNHN